MFFFCHFRFVFEFFVNFYYHITEAIDTKNSFVYRAPPETKRIKQVWMANFLLNETSQKQITHANNSNSNDNSNGTRGSSSQMRWLKSSTNVDCIFSMKWINIQNSVELRVALCLLQRI